MNPILDKKRNSAKKFKKTQKKQPIIQPKQLAEVRNYNKPIKNIPLYTFAPKKAQHSIPLEKVVAPVEPE